jgi:uncharacterized protein involved in exopolysaccharide biosynthesis
VNGTTENQYSDEMIDLRLLLAEFWKKRWWIVCATFFFSAAFTIAVFTITPVYRATTVLMPASSERGSSGVLGSALGQLGGLASLAGINVGSADSETEEAIAVLQSRQFTERFISDNNLMPDLFANKWDGENAKWKVAEKDQPSASKAYKYFNKKICSVIRDKKTGLIILQIDWKDRVKAAAWANELVQRLNVEMRARAIAKTDASVGYLEKEMRATSVIGTQEAISRLIEAQVKQRMLANVTPEYAFRVVDRATVSDPDDPVRPQKLTLLIAGPFVGVAIGMMYVLISRLFERTNKKMSC